MNICGNGADHFFEYEIPSNGAARYFREALRLRPSIIVVVCIDSSNTVRNADQIQIN
jgi:hypothetical protein